MMIDRSFTGLGVKWRGHRDQEGLGAEDSPQQRNSEVGAKQKDRVWQSALGRERQKPRHEVDKPETRDVERLTEAPIVEGSHVIEEHPVVAIAIADVGLEDEQLPARTEEPVNLLQRQENRGPRQMLEKVAREGTVGRAGLDRWGVMGRRGHDEHAGGGVTGGVGI